MSGDPRISSQKWQCAPARPRAAVLLSAIGPIILASCTTPGGERNAEPGTSAIATSSSASTPQPEPSDRVATEFLVSLQKGAIEDAEANFSDQLHSALPVERLRQVWQALILRFGQLLSWEEAGRATQAGILKLTFRLRFDRGFLRALVNITQTDAKIAGVYFVPDSTAGGTFLPRGAPDGFAYREREVKLGPTAVGGTLLLPRKKGSYPAVLLLPGSGPQDRDETNGTSKLFRDLAEGLAQNGIGSIRFDKRSYTDPLSVNALTVTVEEEMLEDGRAALRLLEKDPEVRHSAIFLLGHSLGGYLAPELAREMTACAGLILLAAPGRPILDVLLQQVASNELASSDELARLEGQVEEMRRGKVDSERLILGVGPHYWKDLEARDELLRASGLDIPVLYLRGSRDRNVVQADADAWRGVLADHSATTLFVSLPGLGHFFTGDCSAAERFCRARDDVIVTISCFIDEQECRSKMKSAGERRCHS